ELIQDVLQACSGDCSDGHSLLVRPSPSLHLMADQCENTDTTEFILRLASTRSSPEPIPW
ncbi:hypothetical protein STEG23_006672, partial [Scotinomys teguina]